MFIVRFTDDPAKVSERARHMAAHLAFLTDHAEAIRAAGPLADAVSGAAAGGLWVVDAPDQAGVEALVRADPLWATGLRTAVEILSWTRVFADGAVLIPTPLAAGSRD